MNDVESTLELLKDLSDKDWIYYYSTDEVSNIAKYVIKLLNKQPQIVRCVECKHGEKSPTFRYYPNLTWCNKYERSHDDDWFCADGKKRTEEMTL